MKQKRSRAISRRKMRENAKRFKRVRAEADEIRAKYDLCAHGDDRRLYRTTADRDSDQSPPLVCPECGKRKLRIAVFVKASADLPNETAQVVLNHFLEQDNG